MPNADDVAQLVAQAQARHARTLTVMLSRRCNLRCASCISGSGPSGPRSSSTIDLVALVREALLLRARVGWPTTLAFTGGEPLLHLGEIARAGRLAAESGLRTGVVTNAFWARTPAATSAALRTLSAIDRVDVSTDARHLEGVPLATVRNAVVGLLESGQLGTIRVVRQPKDDSSYLAISEMLSSLGCADRLVPSPLVPLDANGAPRLDPQRKSPEPPLTPCSSAGPVIEPGGRVVACCGPLGNAEAPHALVLGVHGPDTLEDIHAAFQRSVVAHALRVGGVLELLAVCRDAGLPVSLPGSHDAESPCYSCFHLVLSIGPAGAQRLAQTPTAIARIALLRFTLFGEEAGIDALSPQEVVVAQQLLRRPSLEEPHQ